MGTNRKIIIGCVLLIIAVLYWVLAPIGAWLTVDDSAAVEKFTANHRFIAAFAAGVWLLDRMGLRYVLIPVLAITFWWIIRNRSSKT